MRSRLARSFHSAMAEGLCLPKPHLGSGMRTWDGLGILFWWLLGNSRAQQSDWTQSLWPEGRRVLMVCGSPHLFPGPKAIAQQVGYFQGKACIPVSRSLLWTTLCTTAGVVFGFRRVPGTGHLPVAFRGEGFCSRPRSHHCLPGITFSFGEGWLKGTSVSFTFFSFLFFFCKPEVCLWECANGR